MLLIESPCCATGRSFYSLSRAWIADRLYYLNHHLSRSSASSRPQQPQDTILTNYTNGPRPALIESLPIPPPTAGAFNFRLHRQQQKSCFDFISDHRCNDDKIVDQAPNKSSSSSPPASSETPPVFPASPSSSPGRDEGIDEEGDELDPIPVEADPDFAKSSRSSSSTP